MERCARCCAGGRSGASAAGRVRRERATAVLPRVQIQLLEHGQSHHRSHGRAATGQSYEHELQSLVLGPLGLHHTALPVTVAMPRPVFHGYQLNDGKQEDLSSAINPAWVWAAGGMVSTPADLNRFARGYVSGRLFSSSVRRTQARTLVKGDSEPPGPGSNSAGLAIFRYRTRCGTVYGHTGNFPGYTQFFAATLDGRQSATVSINEQLRPDVDAHVFGLLERADTLAVCAALAH